MDALVVRDYGIASDVIPRKQAILASIGGLKQTVFGNVSIVCNPMKHLSSFKFETFSLSAVSDSIVKIEKGDDEADDIDADALGLEGRLRTQGFYERPVCERRHGRLWGLAHTGPPGVERA